MKKFFAAVFACILILQAFSLSAYAYTASDDVKGTACLSGWRKREDGGAECPEALSLR